MGSILGSYSWEFVASEGGLEIGIAFGNYYRRCCESSFKAKYPEDALALNATLLIRDSPSPLQLECFGEGFFDLMRDAFKQRVPTNDVADERKLIRDWLDGLVDDDWKREVTLGRLENVAVTKKLLPLKRYLIQAVSEFERVQKNSYSEADGIASFVMPLLRKFYHKPDEARLA
ncbi:hypothetical protein BCR41DRAFT_344193 [Lobosporangium transversale]|uniref:Uncharacterized protein n=1 Tax=Lobosporangium transversale TaxID=64571 RepID=A0A1Y2H2T4_9FUNG|nr:hypothetical protein BCR41DRAFT_344193 [Lobosporangium transversale]ORZ28858.1 hypothetical protein BCR41DRAFT_344193 [Lobosporangium transversale]|eukprot:XP_021886531.1 hypothetical protein BCR41DRAFT_344193 [Lobosporangium transversale]